MLLFEFLILFIDYNVINIMKNELDYLNTKLKRDVLNFFSKI